MSNTSDNIDKIIDANLQIRRRALLDLEKAIEDLYLLGVRFLSPSENEDVPEVLASQELLPRFEQTLEDWEWKAVYDDGTEIDQNGEVEHHFGHIDQSKLAKLIYISNFIVPNDNVEKRCVVSLDFREGTFDFLNCGPMEVRGQLKPCKEEKELILFKRKRESFTASLIQKGNSAEVSPTGEKFIYQRYFLGYRLKSDKNKKVAICLCPNSDVQIEFNQI